MRLGIIRIHPEQFLVCAQGLLNKALPLNGNTEIHAVARIIGIHPNRS